MLCRVVRRTGYCGVIVVRRAIFMHLVDIRTTEPSEVFVAFRLRRTETVPAGIRRIARERIDDAIAQLQRSGDDHAEGVHQARKRFKEIRAVLRLVRYEMGDRFRVENRWYRDTARALAQARDAQAAIETWDKLRDSFPEQTGTQSMAPIRGRLEQRLERIANEGRNASSADVLAGLEAAHERVERWPLYNDEFAALKAGVKRTYAQGRREQDTARANGTDEAFHEWRKRVKDLWYHTTLLRRTWDDVMSARKRQLKMLSDGLGDDHDLVVFGQLIQDEPGLFGAKRQQAQLLDLIEARQQSLREQAHELGGLLYAEKPGAYARRLEAYWHIWRRAAQIS